MTKKEKDIADIDRYLHYGMAKKEMLQFSKRLITDKELAKEFAFQKSKLDGDIENDSLAKLQLVLKQKQRQMVMRYVIGMLVALGLIVAVGYFMMTSA